jgi:hypothetical protein
MFLVIDLAEESVRLEDPAAFDRFSVEVAGHQSAAATEALAAVVSARVLGRLHTDGAHVVVDPDAIRRLAGPAVTADWESGFAGMCAYAEGKGWVVDGGILAHIAWRGDPAD